jgi:putative transposase
MSTAEEITYYRRNLPHFTKEFAIYFVTFRLAGSIPEDVLCRQREDRMLQRKKEPPRSFADVDGYLDKCARGVSWLSTAEVAESVERVILSGDGSLYALFAYCIMPNHVHLVIQSIIEKQPLWKILRLLKMKSAKQANDKLGRKGSSGSMNPMIVW